VDALAATVLAAAVAIAISARLEAGAKEPDALAYAVGAAMAVPLLFWRRWPLGALLATAAVVMIYHSLGYPSTGLAVPLAPALFTAVYAGRIRPAVTLVVGLELLAVAYRGIQEGEPIVTVVGGTTIIETLLLASVVLLAEALRSRRALIAEMEERQRRTKLDREREAERRVREERLRIAREMHDVLAHTVTVIGVQAGAAEESLTDAPEAARSSLRSIREKSREAMAEIRATIGVLREEDDAAPRSPSPRLAQLEGLVDLAADAEVTVEVTVAGKSRPLPAVVDLAAYRIVQESLTNVLRHAGAQLARVTISYEPDTLVVRVEDDGHGSRGARAVADGHGLAGMRERAEAVGGRFEAGPAPFPGRGFRVQAWLPTAEVSS
jgi:signal transduction histidine kinase